MFHPNIIMHNAYSLVSILHLSIYNAAELGLNIPINIVKLPDSDKMHVMHVMLHIFIFTKIRVFI